MSIENTILRHIIHDDDFARKTLPFLKDEYFQNGADKLVFSEINKFMLAYNSRPTREALLIEIESKTGLEEQEFSDAVKMVKDELDIPESVDKDWLLNKTEAFCQERAVYNAVMNSIHILDGKDKLHDKNAIPGILTEALSVSFDTHIGHDFLEDFNERFEFYHRIEERIPFDLEMLNRITRGGLPRKSLNMLLGGVGGGKTLSMCHMAAAALASGKNVLYITMEMAEERIAERIDANLLNIAINDIENMTKERYDSKIGSITSKTKGKLIIKEFPTASAHVGHFRHLLNELNLKRSFKPDIIFIDYINICTSARLKQGPSINSYTFIKSIAEEVRGLAVERNIPIVSATQLTRSGFSSSDPGMDDTSESFGLPATVDLLLAIISNDQLDQLGQIMFKQLKNRYNDMNIHKRFVVGIDRGKMRLFDLEESAQANIMQDSSGPAQSAHSPRRTADRPVMDNSKFGSRDNENSSMKFVTKKAGPKDFTGWKLD